jgi:hypothetical protein
VYSVRLTRRTTPISDWSAPSFSAIAASQPPPEGAKVSFDLVADRRSGKSSAGNLRMG